jgi:hypothetical protein
MRRKMPSPRTSLAGTQVGLSLASGARFDQVRVLLVGGIQPGEPGQRTDLAEPFGLHDVGVDPGQRPRYPASVEREVRRPARAAAWR